MGFIWENNQNITFFESDVICADIIFEWQQWLKKGEWNWSQLHILDVSIEEDRSGSRKPSRELCIIVLGFGIRFFW